MTPSLRSLHLEDLERMTTLMLLAWKDTVDPRSSGHRLTLEEMRSIFVEHPNTVGWVLEQAEKLVASVYVTPRAGTGAGVWWVRGLAVHPDARGQGLARRLLEHIEAQAQGSGVLELRLGVGQYNRLPLPMYKKMGYSTVPDAIYPFGSQTPSSAQVLRKTLKTATITGLNALSEN